MSHAFIAIISLFVGIAGPNHPGHTSLAIMEHDAKKGVCEMSFEVSALALESELGAATKKKIDLSRADDKVEKLVADWLSKHFIVTNTNKKALPWTWVGMEIEDGSLWIYAEMNVGSSMADFSLQNDALTEGQPWQINSVSLSSGLKTWTGNFSALVTTKKVAFPKPKPKR